MDIHAQAVKNNITTDNMYKTLPEWNVIQKETPLTQHLCELANIVKPPYQVIAGHPTVTLLSKLLCAVVSSFLRQELGFSITELVHNPL